VVGCVVDDSLAEQPSKTAGNCFHNDLFNGGLYCGQEEEGCQEVSQEEGKEEEEVVSPRSVSSHSTGPAHAPFFTTRRERAAGIGVPIFAALAF
jgi:hypothetical protein